MTRETRTGLAGPDTPRDRVAKRAAGIAVLCVTAGGAYYFIAAVTWLLSGSWPEWSLREAGIGAPVGPDPGRLQRAVELLLDGSPGLLALLLGAAFGLLAVLFDRRPKRR